MSSPFFSKHTSSNARSLSKNMSAPWDYIIQCKRKAECLQRSYTFWTVHSQKIMTKINDLIKNAWKFLSFTFQRQHLENMSSEPTNQKQMKRLRWLLANLKSSPNSRGQILWSQCWVFTTVADYLPNQNQPSGEAPRQTDKQHPLPESGKAELPNITILWAQKNQGFTTANVLRSTILFQRRFWKSLTVKMFCGKWKNN